MNRRARRARRRKWGDHGPFLRFADTPYTYALCDHIERWLGEAEQVHYEVCSRFVNVDVAHVPPRPGQPFHTLVTMGMSARPMRPPREAAGCRRAELVLMLPPEWPVGAELVRSGAASWPFEELVELARLPHAERTWLWSGHTVAEEEPRPLHASTELCAWLLTCPRGLPGGFHRFDPPGGEPIWFFAAMPLYREELALKLDAGPELLLALFDAAGVTPVLDPERPNVAAPSGRLQ